MNKEELRAAILSADISEPYGYGCGESMAFETGVELALARAAELVCPTVGDGIELDVTDNPNWDLEIPLVMGAVERGALAHRIRAWGAQQFAAGKAAALAELHPHYEAEKQRADRLQAQANEAAFDQLLHDPRELAQQDADAFGIGFIVDGQRVVTHRVQVFVPAAKATGTAGELSESQKIAMQYGQQLSDAEATAFVSGIELGKELAARQPAPVTERLGGNYDPAEYA